MIKVLITGGNGYIAKSLHSALRLKYDVTLVTRRDFDLLDTEATSEYFEGKYFDFVIHTAVVGGSRLKQENQTTIQDNLHMYWNLLANQQYYGKFVNFGSGAELGIPTSPYGISKKAIADSMFKRQNFLNIRIFAVFDENELDTRFIKANIKRYIDKQPIVVYENKQMDFFYMLDLVSLVEYFLQKEEWFDDEVDCTYLTSYTLAEIANMINELDDHKVEIVVGNINKKPYIGIYRGLPCKLVGLEQGIKNVYKIIKQKSK